MDWLFEILYEYLLYLQITITRLLRLHKTHVYQGKSSYYIIFISGIFGGTSMYHLKRFARKHKISYILVDLGFQLGNIDEYAHQLKSELKFHSIKGKNIFVGYSMGGLIALRFTQLFGWQDISKMIAIATPFKGALVNDYLPFFAAKQMRPGSPYLPNLLKGVKKEKIICGYFKDDRFVPKQSAVLAGCKSHEFPYGGHFTNAQKRNFEDFCKKYFI